MHMSNRERTENFSSTTTATGNMYSVKKYDDTTLHNRVAKFVLDIKSDVTLEDLLDNGESTTRNIMQPAPQKPKYHLNEQQHQALKQLYDEIKSHQNGMMNAHEWSAKRRQAEHVIGINKTKVPRHNECLLNDSDNVDENWLMSLAAELGLDKDVALPELNSDFVMQHT